MANNRMYLRCTECNTALFLGKTMGEGYYYRTPPDLEGFFEEHETCAIVNENTFVVEYEAGAPELPQGVAYHSGPEKHV